MKKKTPYDVLIKSDTDKFICQMITYTMDKKHKIFCKMHEMSYFQAYFNN